MHIGVSPFTFAFLHGKNLFVSWFCKLLNSQASFVYFFLITSAAGLFFVFTYILGEDASLTCQFMNKACVLLFT